LETALSQQINLDNHHSMEESREGAPEGTLVPFKDLASLIIVPSYVHLPFLNPPAARHHASCLLLATADAIVSWIPKVLMLKYQEEYPESTLCPHKI
jgi:hypothetical protein